MDYDFCCCGHILHNVAKVAENLEIRDVAAHIPTQIFKLCSEFKAVLACGALHVLWKGKWWDMYVKFWPWPAVTVSDELIG